MRASQIVTFAGVGSLGAGGWFATKGVLDLAALMTAIGLFCLIVSAQLLGVLPSPRPARSQLRKAGTFAVVGMVITVAALGGAAGPLSASEPARAQTAGDVIDCSAAVVHSAMLTAAGADTSAIAGFRSVSERCSPTPDTKNLTQTDAYAGAKSQQDSSQRYVNSMENFAENSKGAAWSKAKLAISNELANGSSKAEAKAAAKEAVRDFYSAQIRNLVSDHDARTSWYLYTANTTTVEVYSTSGGTRLGNLHGEVVNYTYVLPNNDTVQASSPVWRYYDDTTGTYHTPGSNVENGSANHSANSESTMYFVISHPDEPDVEFNVGKYTAAVEAREQAVTQVNANIDTYVDDVYAAYQQGDLDPGDILDPTTLVTQSAEQAAATSYYGFANTEAAAMGMSGTENSSHTVNTTRNVTNDTDGDGIQETVTQQVNASGTVWYTGSDNVTLETGSTYDPANFSGEFYMSVAGMESGNQSVNHSDQWFHLTEPFTVTETTDVRTGESLNKTTYTDKNLTTTDASKLTQELDRLREVRNYYEDQLAAAGAGGGSDRTTLILLGAAALLGAGVMSRRDN